MSTLYKIIKNIYHNFDFNQKHSEEYYSKTCLKRNLKGPEHFSAKARFPFNQGTLQIKN